jgi:hypothetical protein
MVMVTDLVSPLRSATEEGLICIDVGAMYPSVQNSKDGPKGPKSALQADRAARMTGKTNALAVIFMRCKIGGQRGCYYT